MSNPERYVQPNFYALPGFPYFGDPAWSSGGDPLSYLGYGQPNNEYMPGNPMLNPFDYSHGGLAWSSFPQAADFVWGAAASSVRKEVHVGSDSAPVYDYYASSPPHVYAAAVNGEMEMEMRALEHGLQAVGVSDEGELSQESRGGSGHVVVSDGVGGEVRGVASSGDQASAGAGGSSSATNCAAAPLPPVKKPMSWASVASQPAKSPQQLLQQQPHLRAGRHVAVVQMPTSNSGAATGDANSTWDRDEAGGADASKGGRQPSAHARQPPQLLLHQPQQAAWSVPRAARGAGQQQHASTVGNSDPSVANLDNAAAVGAATAASSNLATAPVSHPVLEKLKSTNMYNPANFDLNPKNPRFFIIKSYSEDDIHRSIKYNIWCSTDHGNKRLDAAYQERAGRGPVFLFFSVNGSGHFCGMAQMVSPVDYNSHSGVWTQDKWKGQFEVKWIYVKDVPNGQLRHIRLENNENKPVTNSRDTQEVPPEKGKQVLKIMHSYRHTTSIFDDFGHYEKKQEEDESKKRALPVGEY